jgi:hypothetical protein
MDRLKRLLAKGYFPSQLPPAFSSAKFAKRSRILATIWSQYRNDLPSTRGETVSVARAGYVRRTVTIPNPINQFFVVQEIAQYWPELQKHFKLSTLSLSKPTMRSKDRATEIAPLSELHEKRLLFSAGFNYILRTDVARFFPSLYTHSLPWALHGKQAAKLNHKAVPQMFGNILDRALRGCQDNQTVGIPVGPDTSHIISEVIATAIDIRLQTQMKEQLVGYRHVDDFFLCFNDRAQAQNAVTLIVQALAEYELAINAFKTEIVAVKDVLEETWIDDLRSLSIEGSPPSFDFFGDSPTTSSRSIKQRRSIDKLFSTAFALARSHTDENVMKYALRRSAGAVVDAENWPIYEAYIVKVARAYPNTMQTVAHILSTYRQLGYKIDTKRVSAFCYNTIRENAPIANHSEVLWALWILKEFGIPLKNEIAKTVVSIDSAVCALVFLDLMSEGRVEGPIDLDHWRLSVNSDGLRGGMWLLAYEAAVKGWIPGVSTVFLANDAYFGPLEKLKVSFYFPKRELKPLIKRKPLGGKSSGWMNFEFTDESEEYVA